MKERFSDYFSKNVETLIEDKIISDESLFRDYSRLGDRKVDFERIRNPFNLSKYTISSYEKTWYIFKEDKCEGPYNSYEMDTFFKQEEIKKSTKIAMNLKVLGSTISLKSFIPYRELNSRCPLKTE